MVQFSIADCGFADCRRRSGMEPQSGRQSVEVCKVLDEPRLLRWLIVVVIVCLVFGHWAKRHQAGEITIPLLVYGVEKAILSVWRADFLGCLCKGLQVKDLGGKNFRHFLHSLGGIQAGKRRGPSAEPREAVIDDSRRDFEFPAKVLAVGNPGTKTGVETL